MLNTFKFINEFSKIYRNIFSYVCLFVTQKKDFGLRLWQDVRTDMGIGISFSKLYLPQKGSTSLESKMKKVFKFQYL